MNRALISLFQALAPQEALSHLSVDALLVLERTVGIFLEKLRDHINQQITKGSAQ